MDELPFRELRGEKHVCLTTFRANGDGVPTAVWFAQEGRALYVRTAERFGKVGRLRANPRVTLAACDPQGVVTGPLCEARGRVMEPGEAELEHADEILQAKYGAEREAMTQIMEEQREPLVYLEVRPTTEA